MTNLLKYLPDFLKKYEEFQIIARTENVEFENLKDEIGLILKNCFVQTCNEDNMGYFESLYGSFAPEGLSIEERRNYCKMAIFLRHIPITEWILYYWVYYMNNGLVDYHIDYENYTVYISSDLPFDKEKNFALWVNNWLREKIPANMALKVTYTHSHNALGEHTHEQLSEYTHAQLEETEE